MPSLKDIKNQINSVGSTKKITSAMKMVAASKLRRSQEKAEAARPYSSRIEEMLSSLATSGVSGEGVIQLLSGTGRDDRYLVVPVTADRGLCGGFNSSIIVFNKFKSAISQEVTHQQIIPLEIQSKEKFSEKKETKVSSVYTYEPDEETILKDLLPKNLSIQIFKVLLESNAGEQGARMAAMDNATRNAGEMINNLTLVYNRTRQAFITKELIEIISGAESV